MSTRKRRAPGASPQAPAQAFQQDISGLNDQYMNWTDSNLGTNVGGFNDNSLFDPYGASLGGAGHNRVVSLDGVNDGAEMNTGQLIRRNTNQQLATAPRRNQWDGFSTEVPQWEELDDDADLEQKAQAAKKDAQAKRKQIPPFVQKLSR